MALDTPNQRHYLYQPIQRAEPNRDQTMRRAQPGWSRIRYAAVEACAGGNQYIIIFIRGSSELGYRNTTD